MQTTSSKSGCGCGGSGGTKTSGGCGCSGGCSGGCGCKPARLPESAPAICSPCETASFIRPRFFAGQLLTEDDLGALIDYVVTKNRFHNARLFGAGVVCGLEVECGPCDGSQIVVQPGYALDCCGNDLVLTCKQTLDLVPMIRDLAAQRDGGCVDPCPPPAPANSLSTRSGQQQPQDPPPNKHYCLYAKYAERPDQPVAAYPVGDDCDAASCEPTRIVEGIVFELRCPAECNPLTIHDAQKACSDWIDQDAELSTHAVGFRSAALALPAFDPKRGTAYSEDEVETLRQGARDLETIIAHAKGPERTVALARYVAMVVGPFSRHRLLDVQLPAGVEAERIEANAKRAVGELADADLTKLAPLEAATVRASLDAYRIAHDKPDLKSPEIQAFLYGSTASPEMLQLGAEQLDAMSARLQQLAGCGKHKVHTDCLVPDLIDKLKPGWSSYAKAKDQLDAAAGAIERFLLDCRCAAFNPPCPPCDDTGVLLACFEVDHCKVVKICNTARCYVLAPTTLRYWGLIDTAVMFKRCCAAKPAGKPKPSPADTRSYGLAPAPADFYYAPHTQQNLAYLTALEAPANLRERLVPRLAIPNLATAHETEVADLRRRLAALASRLEKLENPDKPEKLGKLDKLDKKERS
jgi:hypothetical protein